MSHSSKLVTPEDGFAGSSDLLLVCQKHRKQPEPVTSIWRGGGAEGWGESCRTEPVTCGIWCCHQDRHQNQNRVEVSDSLLASSARPQGITNQWLVALVRWAWHWAGMRNPYSANLNRRSQRLMSKIHTLTRGGGEHRAMSMRNHRGGEGKDINWCVLGCFFLFKRHPSLVLVRYNSYLDSASKWKMELHYLGIWRWVIFFILNKVYFLFWKAYFCSTQKYTFSKRKYTFVLERFFFFSFIET